jgi:hypothetical protein
VTDIDQYKAETEDGEDDGEEGDKAHKQRLVAAKIERPRR